MRPHDSALLAAIFVAAQPFATQPLAAQQASRATPATARTASSSEIVASSAYAAVILPATRNDTAQLTAKSRVAVAARDLARGAVIEAADIAYTSDSATIASWGRGFARPNNGVRGNSQSVAAGWVTRRAIRAGEPLIEPSVTRPDLVRAGDPVDVIYIDEGIRIKLSGVAVGNGSKGDEIYVKLDNRRRLRGVIDNAHTVRIP
jgi:flagella basal body P-ring formation protein FlgA